MLKSFAFKDEMDMKIFQKENLMDFMCLLVKSNNKPVNDCLEDSDDEDPNQDSKGRRVPENT